MKKSVIAIFALNIAASIPPSMEPGCTRKNSEGIIRDLLFMQIDYGQMDFVITLLNVETMSLKNLSGQTVMEKLEEVRQKKVDINPVLNYLRELSEKKAKMGESNGSSSPIADLPD